MNLNCSPQLLEKYWGLTPLKNLFSCVEVEERTPKSLSSSALATVYSWLCFFYFLPFRILKTATKNLKRFEICVPDIQGPVGQTTKPCKWLHLLSTALYLQLKKSSWRYRSLNRLIVALVWLFLLFPGWALCCFRGTGWSFPGLGHRQGKKQLYGSGLSFPPCLFLWFCAGF